MRVPSGQPRDAFVVVEAVEVSESGQHLLLEAVLDKAEEILEVCQYGEYVRGEALQRYELQSSHLDALPLEQQHRDLLLRQRFLHDLPAPFQHLLRQHLQQLPVVHSFVLRERLEVVLVGQEQKLQLRQYVCKTFGSRFLKFLDWLGYGVSLRFAVTGGLHCIDGCFGREDGIGPHSLGLALLGSEGRSGGLVLEIDHLDLVDESALGTVLDGDVVILVDEVLEHGLLGLPLLREDGAHLIPLPQRQLLHRLALAALLPLRLLVHRPRRLRRVLALRLQRFGAFRFGQTVRMLHLLAARAVLQPLGSPFRQHVLGRLRSFERFAMLGVHLGRGLQILFGSVYHFLRMLIMRGRGNKIQQYIGDVDPPHQDLGGAAEQPLLFAPAVHQPAVRAAAQEKGVALPEALPHAQLPPRQDRRARVLRHPQERQPQLLRRLHAPRQLRLQTHQDPQQERGGRPQGPPEGQEGQAHRQRHQPHQEHRGVQTQGQLHRHQAQAVLRRSGRPHQGEDRGFQDPGQLPGRVRARGTPQPHRGQPPRNHQDHRRLQPLRNRTHLQTSRAPHRADRGFHTVQPPAAAAQVHPEEVDLLRQSQPAHHRAERRGGGHGQEGAGQSRPGTEEGGDHWRRAEAGGEPGEAEVRVQQTQVLLRRDILEGTGREEAGGQGATRAGEARGTGAAEGVRRDAGAHDPRNGAQFGGLRHLPLPLPLIYLPFPTAPIILMIESFAEEGGLSATSDLIEEKEEKEEKEEERVVVRNLSKLGYHQLFYQKERQLLVEDLGGWERSFTLKQYYDLKDRHEKAIKKFKSAHVMDEMDGIKKRRRANSIDTEATGAFYLNNWLSHEEYPCDKPPPEEKTANLFYELLLLRWNKALELISCFEMTPEVTTLQYIIMCFKAVSSLLTDEDKSLTEHFMGRATHEIKVKQSSESVGGMGSFVNVLEDDSKTKFWEIRSLPKRVECLKINLDFLVKFTNNYIIRTEDCYLQLCFLFLGNKCNQQSYNLPADKDYYHLLLRLDLKLSDRLNFATKLLSEKKRKDFCNELEDRLCSFARLDNILFYTANPTSKNKEEKIEKVVKAYLDKYGDLETIAYLAHEFTFLRKYYSQFKQALQLASEHKELERLETYKFHSEKDGVVKELEKKSSRRADSFLGVVNVAEEKIADWHSNQELPQICEICCKKIGKEDFLQCGKCHHGGHIPHLLKWFDEYENCPHIGCPCLCN